MFKQKVMKVVVMQGGAKGKPQTDRVAGRPCRRIEGGTTERRRRVALRGGGWWLTYEGAPGSCITTDVVGC